MSKTSCPWQVDQPQLPPHSVREFVPDGHVAHFICELVRDDLGFSAILGAYDEDRGCPPFDPRMMMLYQSLAGALSARAPVRAKAKPGGRPAPEGR